MTTLSTLEQCPSEVLDRILLFCAANDEASVSPTRSRWRMLTLSKTLYLLVERALYARVRLSNSKQRDGYRQRISSRPDLGDLCLRLQHNYLHCGSQLDDLVAMLTSLRTMEIKTYTEVAQPGLESLLAVLGSRAALRTVILDLPLILGKLVPLPATLCHVAHLRLGRLISAPDESDLVPVWRSISIAGLAQGTYGNWTTSLLAAQSTLHSLDVSTLEISDVAALVDILVGLRKTLRSLSFRLSSTDMDAGWLWEVIGESQLQQCVSLGPVSSGIEDNTVAQPCRPLARLEDHSGTSRSPSNPSLPLHRWSDASTYVSRDRRSSFAQAGRSRPPHDDLHPLQQRSDRDDFARASRLHSFLFELVADDRAGLRSRTRMDLATTRRRTDRRRASRLADRGLRSERFEEGGRCIV